MTNSDLIVTAYEKAHPSDNLSASAPCLCSTSGENADLIDELIVRIQMMEGRVRRWESAAAFAGDSPEELDRFIRRYEDQRSI